MKRLLTTALALTVYLLSGCGEEQLSKVSETKDHSAQQRALLAQLPLGPLADRQFSVPKPSSAEKKVAKAYAKANAGKTEVRYLRKSFGEHWDLWAYAMRDSDGDGVFDYRVNTAGEGRFYEGDTDLDGDGVRNIQDADPYDPAVGLEDDNGNGIADQIDWTFTRAEDEHFAELVQLQESLYRDYDVILFERSDKFPIDTARAISDTLRYVFPKPMATLKQVASEKFAWLYPDEGITNAMVFTPSESMMIYGESLQMDPIFQLGLIVHEMAHSWQYDMDWNDEDPTSEFSRTYFEMTNFKKEVAPFRWKPRNKDIHKWKQLSGFASLDENKNLFLWRNKTPEWWQNWLLEIWNEDGDAYLDNPKVVNKGIVGDYCLTDPLEWHADQLNAYVISRIEDHLLARLDTEAAEIVRARIRAVEQETWPGFKHGNVRKSPTWKKFKKQFPLRKRALDRLAERYVERYLKAQ